MDLKTPIRILLGLFLITSACNEPAGNIENETGTAALIEEVKAQVQAFHAADTSLNADGVVALLWPEFTMLVDGNRTNYNDVKTGSKAFMATLETFHTEWDDLSIIPLGNDHAISSFLFTDSLVAKDGTITRAKGPNTFVWERRDGEWKVLYADADHYPIEE